MKMTDRQKPILDECEECRGTGECPEHTPNTSAETLALLRANRNERI